jgi:hypothetical protein
MGSGAQCDADADGEGKEGTVCCSLPGRVRVDDVFVGGGWRMVRERVGARWAWMLAVLMIDVDTGRMWMANFGRSAA